MARQLLEAMGMGVGTARPAGVTGMFDRPWRHADRPAFASPLASEQDDEDMDDDEDVFGDDDEFDDDEGFEDDDEDFLEDDEDGDFEEGEDGSEDDDDDDEL
jgi:hypothetical protein